MVGVQTPSGVCEEDEKPGKSPNDWMLSSVERQDRF